MVGGTSMLHNVSKAPVILTSAREVRAVQAPWRNLQGPARFLAICGTVLLVASAMLGIEAAIMLILGQARSIVVKPFILLGYLEACAILFSSLGIVCGIVGLIFYRPYLYFHQKMLEIRARRAGEVSDKYTVFEDVNPAAPVHNPEEDGAPD